MAFVTLDNVYKRYHMGEITINAADGMTFDIQKGEFAIIVGPSGSGKTTVLNMLGGMDTCDEGVISVDGERIDRFNRRQLTNYRRYDVGFIFQFYNLMPNLTAKENVELAAQTTKDFIPAAEILKKVGLGERLQNFPAQLSGGEQQRVSIARAKAPAVRRANRRARLQHRQDDTKAASGYLPDRRYDRDTCNAQFRYSSDG